MAAALKSLSAPTGLTRRSKDRDTLAVPISGRVLIAWDWEADGVWWLPVRSGTGRSEDRTENTIRKPHAWSDLLSAELIDALKMWNDSADSLYGPKSDPTGMEEAKVKFWESGRRLAERVQSELGPQWQVLYQEANGAWTWVHAPFSSI
jgi:hypothetical protein